MIVALVWYAVTRILQTALLIWMLVIADADLRSTAPYIISATVAAALSLVQAYTFRIYAVRRLIRCHVYAAVRCAL